MHGHVMRHDQLLPWFLGLGGGRVGGFGSVGMGRGGGGASMSRAAVCRACVGLGFRVWGLGFGVWGLRFRV